VGTTHFDLGVEGLGELGDAAVAEAITAEQWPTRVRRGEG